ncbi:hypothetical protein EC991_001250 [Linnemannia zychae]|nr:hypothetical protein EC991_001250 [Linnemannia zychae]
MTTSHLKNFLSGNTSAEKPVAPEVAGTHKPAVTETPSNTVEDKEDDVATTQGKASDHMLTAGSRKRSILLNMMLPPEPLAVDAKLTLPPVVLFPPVLEPEGSITIQDRSMDVTAETHLSASTTTSNSTSWSLRSWAWGGKDGAGQISKRTKGHHSQSEEHHKDNKHKKKSDKEAKPNGVVKTVNMVESKTTTTVSKTTQVRTWMSRIGGTRSDGDDSTVTTIGANSNNNVAALETTTVPGGMVQQQRVEQQQQQQLTTAGQSSSSQVQVDQHGNMMAVQQRQEIIHQEIHQKTRSVALVSVNVSVSDVFGIGKVMEVILALFHAHGAFLRRNPFWLQCVLMAWEGVVVLMLIWGLLRVVGLAEVIVWGADDLIRGTLSTVQMLGRTLQTYLSPY